MAASPRPACTSASALPLRALKSAGLMCNTLSNSSIAAGADGLLLEVHNDPEHALSDGAQSLFFDQFEKLMAELRIIAPAVGRTIA